jgi:hypothetical protein
LDEEFLESLVVVTEVVLLIMIILGRRKFQYYGSFGVTNSGG